MSKLPVFLSFSGPRSRAVARLLHGWLPDVLQAVAPWTSAEDIETGKRWGVEIGTQLQNTRLGILCLTPETVQPNPASWIMFEAGALSKTMDRSKVTCLCCFGVGYNHVPSPLDGFQNTMATSFDDMLKLLASINRELGEHALSSTQLLRSAERCWPDWESGLRAAEAEEHENIALEEPKPTDMLHEILTRLSTMEKQLQQTSALYTVHEAAAGRPLTGNHPSPEFDVLGAAHARFLRDIAPDSKMSKEVRERIWAVADSLRNDGRRHFDVAAKGRPHKPKE